MTYQRVELGLARRFGGEERDLHAQQGSKAYLSSRGGLLPAPGRLLQIKQGECESQRHQWHHRVGLCMRYQCCANTYLLLPSPNIALANEGGQLEDAVRCCGGTRSNTNNDSTGAVSGEVRAREQGARVCLNLINFHTANGSAPSI